MNIYFLGEKLERDRKETKNFLAKSPQISGGSETHMQNLPCIQTPVNIRPGRLVKTRIAGPTHRNSDLVNHGWSVKICISDMCPGDALASVPGTIF